MCFQTSLPWGKRKYIKRGGYAIESGFDLAAWMSSWKCEIVKKAGNNCQKIWHTCSKKGKQKKIILKIIIKWYKDFVLNDYFESEIAKTSHNLQQGLKIDMKTTTVTLRQSTVTGKWQGQKKILPSIDNRTSQTNLRHRTATNCDHLFFHSSSLAWSRR